MSVIESIEALQLRAFVDDLDRKWSWWSNKKDQLVAPVIPDDRGLIYLHNHAENYVVAVTPLGHDLVYAAEVNTPRRIVSGVIDGKELVLVLTDAGTIEVYSPTLEHLQSIELSEPATDVVWAEDLLWVIGNARHHIDILYVHQDPDAQLVFAPFRFVEGIEGANHIMWLSYSRSVAVVSKDTVYFIAFDELTVESVPLPFEVDHAYAHNSLVVFSGVGNGQAYCLDLASSHLVDLYVVDAETLSHDPEVKRRVGYYDTWHGSYEVAMVSIREPSATELTTVIQSIEKRNGAGNQDQPEIVVLFEEKADHFNLVSTKDCNVGEHYESQAFTLGHEGDPLLVVSDGSSLVIKDESNNETTAQAAWVTNEELKLVRQYNAFDGLHFRSRLEVYEPVDEIVLIEDLHGEMKGMDYQFDGDGIKRLFLSDPVEANGFWVGSFVSNVISVDAMNVVQSVSPSVYTVQPTGTSILTEYRLQYRDTVALRTQFTEWSAEPQAIPTNGKLTGYQLRCYVSTNDINVTPEIQSFAVDQVRHVRITTGFWDTYKTKSLTTAHVQSMSSTALGDVMGTSGLYTSSAETGANLRAVSNDSVSKDGSYNYTLGSTVTVRTMEASYKLVRTAADFTLGNVNFKVQASNSRNWTNTAQAYLMRQLTTRSGLANGAGIHGTQAALQDPIVRMTMLLGGQYQKQLLNSEHVGQSSGFDQDISYGRALSNGETQKTIASQTYHNVMTYSDVQYFIGINTMASRLAHKTWSYTFVTNSIKFNNRASHGSAYPARSGKTQSVAYTGDYRAITEAHAGLIATRYQVPLQAFEGLHSAGQYQRKSVVGYDSQYYTRTGRRIAVGYDKVCAAIQKSSDFQGDTKGSSAKSTSAESVLDFLRSTFLRTNRLALSQTTKAWRSSNPIAKSDRIYSARDVWSGKDEIDRWLASPVASNRTFTSTDIGMVELRHLVLRVGADVNATRLLTNRLKASGSISMTVTTRGMELADPMTAYPAQSYNFSPTQSLSYAPLGTLSLHASGNLNEMFKVSANKSHIADKLRYLVTNQSALQELRYAIRYALDRVMMEAPLSLNFTLGGSTTASLADEILAKRGLIASSGVDPMSGTRMAAAASPAEGMQAATVGSTHEDVAVELRFNQGGSEASAQKLPFAQVKGSSDTAELFYQVLSSWSTESSADKVSFTRALLAADNADDVSYLMSRINSAGSELIKLVAADREVPVAELVKFLTASYLTNSLPDAMGFTMRQSNAFSGTIELVYKTLLRSTYADDVKFVMNKQGNLISTVALRLLRDAAFKWQRSVFDVATGSKLAEAKAVPFAVRSGAKWHYNGEMAVGHHVQQSTLAKAQNLGYVNHTIKKLITNIGLTGLVSLVAGKARLVPYDTSSVPSTMSSVPLRKLSGLSSKTDRLNYTGTTRSSGEADVMPFAMGESKTELKVVPLILTSGVHPAINILNYTTHMGMRALLGNVSLKALSYLGNSKYAQLVARGSHMGAKSTHGQAFTLQGVTKFDTVVRLAVHDDQKSTYSGSYYNLQAPLRASLPTAVGMHTIEGHTSYQDLVKLVRTAPLATKQAQSAGLTNAKRTALEKEASTVIDAGFKRLFGGQHFGTRAAGHTEISRVTVKPTAESSNVPAPVGYNTNDWVAAIQTEAVDWAFSQLKAVPKAVFTRIDRTNPVISELVSFKLDTLNLTIDELIQLVSAKSITTYDEDMPFTKANWTGLQVGVRNKVQRLNAKIQAVYYNQGFGLSRKKAESVVLTTQPSVRYWLDRIESATLKTGTSRISEISTESSSGYSANLAEHTVEYQTLRRTIENQVTTTVVMSQEKTAAGLTYTRVSGGQTHYEDRIEFKPIKTASKVGTARLIKGDRVSTYANQVGLASMTGFATHLGERLLHVRDRQLLREINVNYQTQDALTIVEQAVLLNRLAANALQNKVTLRKDSSLEIAGLQTTYMKQQEGLEAYLADAPDFNITGSQVKAMNTVLSETESARNAIMNDVATQVMNPHSLAMKHVESVIQRWATYLADVTGTKFQVNNIEAAVDLIKISVENLQQVDTTAKVFGAKMRLVDAHAKVMQPLINLHETLSVKEGYLNSTSLADVAASVLNGFNPRFTAIDLAKATDYHLAVASAKLTKATTEHYKKMKISSVTDAIGRHMRIQAVKGFKPRDGMLMNTTYMEKASPFVLTLTKNDFHVEGSLQLINGRKAQTRYVTQRVDVTPWSYSDSMRMKSVAMRVAKTSLDLQQVEFESITGFRHTLSTKAEYWFPKFRHAFPYGLPNWLQDYGHISQGLGRGHTQSPYRASTDQIMATQELELVKQQTDSVSAPKIIESKQSQPTTATSVRMTGNQWVKPLQHTAPLMQSARYHQVLMPTAPSISVMGNAWVKMLDQVDIAASLLNYQQSTMGQRLPVTIEAGRWIVPTRTYVENYRLPKWVQKRDHTQLSRIIRVVQLEISTVDVNRRYSQDVRTRPDIQITDVIRLTNTQAHTYVNKDFIRIDPQYVSSRISYTKWSPFDAISNNIYFEKLKNFSGALTGTLYHQLSESRYATHTKFYQTLTSEMATSTEIKKRLTPHVRPTKTAYSLALPVGVPLGHGARKDYVPIRDIVSTDFWVAMRRDGRGYSLLNDRPIGLRDRVSSSDIRITDMKRINPQNVSSIAKKIEIVLRKSISRLADDLDFERLAAPSESKAYQAWVANLTEVAIDYWDFKQQKVALSSKEHDEVITLMRKNWFGNQWYTQKPESMTEFYHALRQALAEPVESYQSYRQTLESDSAIYNKLVQSDLVSPEVYNSLIEAGLSLTQADMFFAQAKEVSKAHYMRLKQYQLGDNALFASQVQADNKSSSLYNAYDQSDLGDVDLYSGYDQDAVSAKRLDRIYEQYEQGVASLYNSLKAMGLSDARIDEAYAQAAGADAGGIIHSKYDSYQSMVAAVGQAYEQYLLSDPVANMHYKMMKPMDTVEYSKLVGSTLPAHDIIDRYKQASVAKSDDLFIEYAVDMATVLDSIDYSLMKPLPFHDRVDINLPIKYRSEDYRRYKAGIVQIDLMQWLRDLRTKYREELIEKMHKGTARGTYSPRAAMMEAIRNGVVEPILYRDPDDGSWLYRRYTLGDTEYNYIIWGTLN